MLLRDYCALTPRGYQLVAERVGEHRGTIHKIAHGKQGYPPDKGVKICAATDGQVTLEDLARPFTPGFVMPPMPQADEAAA